MNARHEPDILISHSSLSPVLRLGVDAELPGYPALIGLQLEAHVSQPGHYLLIQAPSLSSLETGEMLTFSPETSQEDIEDELDTRLRAELLTLSTSCRTLAANLLSHAERLEREAKASVSLLSAPVPALALSPSPNLTHVLAGPEKAEKATHAQSHVPPRVSPVPSPSDLDIFGD
jgi:hypothetical protein